MSSALINRSSDLSRLRNEGYEADIVGAYLVVRHVPYVTSGQAVEYGDLVCELTLAGDRTARPNTHVAYFTGQTPCHKDGTPIKGIQHSDGIQQLGEGLTVQRSFSNKPPEGYPDYHSLISRYVEILSAPARALKPEATAQTYRPIASPESDSVLMYLDTNSTRGKFQAITEKLRGQSVGIVGLGGTGSYVLDLIAKTPVAEIRLFDPDLFLQHNAFRAPGAPSLDQLAAKPTKVDYLAGIYSKMHRNVRAICARLNGSNLDGLDGLSFVFLCIDSGAAKKQIVERLLNRNIPFVDVGIGVQVTDEKLIGLVRVTTGTHTKNDHLQHRISFADADNDAYSSNIQIAELNMLNAALGVIKWKKMVGFYADYEHEHQSTYSIDTGMLLHEDIHA